MDGSVGDRPEQEKWGGRGEMAASRKTVRDALTTLLSTALVTGGLAQAVYGYRVGDFRGQSPVVVVSGAGSRRARLTRQGSAATFGLQVDVFVVYAVTGSWTEAQAEDALDGLEAAIAGVVDANQVTAQWQALDYGEWSQRVDVEVGGVEYARESVKLLVEVYG